jgi:hypothetical protein
MDIVSQQIRQKQLEVLKRGLEVEEKAVEHYSQYLNSGDFYKQVSKNTAETIQTSLRILYDDSLTHIGLLKTIISQFDQIS